MSELLTKTEYSAIAADLHVPSAAFIDGSYHAASGPSMAIFNPATGAQLTTIAGASDDDVDFAVQKAREAFDSGVWSRCHPSERKEVMIRLCKLMTRNRHELAVMESIDSGKPISDCATIDLPETINTLKWHAEAIDKIYDDSAPVGDDAIAMIVREAVGVVACVLPWNFPMLMLAWKLGPALAAGNSVIVKPAEQTSLTALRIAELAHEAGLPRGVLQILPGEGPTTGQALGRHGDVDMLSFTGSTDTGRHFLRYAADSNLKNVTLECGGKNPAIVLKDAQHLDYVAEQIAMGAFWNMGQNCSAISRLIVESALHDPLMERLIAHTAEWRQGDPLDPANRLGTLVEPAHFDKVKGHLDKAHADGLDCIAGGKTVDGNAVQPTIFDHVPADSMLATEEVFGPILSVLSVNSADEALKLANATEYGLSASVFSASMGPALRTARGLRAGTVTVNSYGEGDITTPFGGHKQSGFGGRDNGLAAHDQFTEIKTIWVDLSDPTPESL